MAAPANPFDRGTTAALAYDAWYDTPQGQSVLAAEVASLVPLLQDAPHPRIDLGTGTGRFGAAFDVDAGIDPTSTMLVVAAARLPSVIQGVTEALPLRSSSVGTVISVATFEFLADPLVAMEEIARVLVTGGVLVLGFFPSDGELARRYEAEGRDPASPFHHARFFTIAETKALAEKVGLHIDRRRLLHARRRDSGGEARPLLQGFVGARFTKS